MRRKIVAANWKMNGSIAQTKKNISDVIAILNQEQAEIATNVIICPPSIYLNEAIKTINSSSTKLLNIDIGAQNCYIQDNGAFTGEISAKMLNDIGCKYVIIGHSERRQIFLENNDLILKKVQSALSSDLLPILCVGETESERKANTTFAVIKLQLEQILKTLDANSLNKLVIAYEPVWAIGTGVTATPAEAEEVHAYIRSLVRDYNIEVSHTMPIIYGGSVKESNAQSLFAMSNIDGALVGGASLIPEDFSKICLSIA